MLPGGRARGAARIRPCLEDWHYLHLHLPRAAGGRLRWLSATAVPLAQLLQGDMLWNGVIMDVTPVKEAEIKLAKYAEELTVVAAQAQAAAKAEVGIPGHHEPRNPRTPIKNGVIGMTSLLLERRQLSAEQRDWGETIRSSGEALLCVINDVLDFSKIEAGKLDLESHPFELRALLEESLELVATQAHRKKLEICALIEDEVSPYALGDPARLRQILLKLLSNAIKFTGEGEEILSARQEAIDGDTARIRFSVRDTGIGITEEVKSKLFQSFSQADSSTTRRYGGTGLGLAISKRLVNLMGGEIGVDSVTGEAIDLLVHGSSPHGRERSFLARRSRASRASGSWSWTTAAPTAAFWKSN